MQKAKDLAMKHAVDVFVCMCFCSIFFIASNFFRFYDDFLFASFIMTVHMLKWQF